MPTGTTDQCATERKITLAQRIAGFFNSDRKRIETLEAKNADLQRQVKELETKNTALKSALEEVEEVLNTHAQPKKKSAKS